MTTINLFTSYWKSDNIKRQSEINFCLQKNVHNSLINKIYLYVDDIDYNPCFTCLLSNNKIQVIDRGYRPTYKDFITTINNEREFKESYNIISNSDIFFDESLKLLDYFKWENTCIVLNRWDIKKNGLSEFLNTTGSQDVWIFKGHIKNELAECSDYYLGKVGCDNAFLYNLFKIKYYCGCPSFNIKAYHYHLTEYRTWKNNTKENVPGPYMFIVPCKISEIKNGQCYYNWYDSHMPTDFNRFKNTKEFFISYDALKVRKWEKIMKKDSQDFGIVGRDYFTTEEEDRIHFTTLEEYENLNTFKNEIDILNPHIIDIAILFNKDNHFEKIILSYIKHLNLSNKSNVYMCVSNLKHVEIAKKYFENVQFCLYNENDNIKWLWTQINSKLFLYIYNSWEMIKDVNLKSIINIFDEYARLGQLIFKCNLLKETRYNNFHRTLNYINVPSIINNKFAKKIITLIKNNNIEEYIIKQYNSRILKDTREFYFGYWCEYCSKKIHLTKQNEGNLIKYVE